MDSGCVLPILRPLTLLCETSLIKSINQVVSHVERRSLPEQDCVEVVGKGWKRNVYWRWWGRQ